MRTRNSYFPNNSFVTILRRQNKRRTLNVVKPELRTIVEVAPMADNRTIEELIQAPTEGYGEAIVNSEINADHFEIKMNLLQLVQANPYHGFERENPHTHINNFKRITSTLKFKDVPNDTDDRIDKLADQISTLVDIFAKKVITLALVKAVDESCVACGGNHAYYNCDATNSNQLNFCVATGTYNRVAPQNCACNYMAPPGFAPVQNSQNRYNHRQGNNFNRGNNFHEPDVPKTLPKPNIPYPSRLNDQKLHEKATNQMDKFFQIFQDLHSDISFADALLLMPKFASTIKSLLTNKDKLFELAKIPLNENCSAMLLKKLLEKLGDLGKFLIPFADFEADPRVPLILGRSFLRTGHALIDVYGEEITLRVDEKAVTFNLNQTMRYSSTYDDLSVNQFDIIYVAKEEYAQEILSFSKNSLGGNPTSTSEPILSNSSPFLTPFKGSDFILEEIEAYLKDESILPKIDHVDYDPKGDICLIEKLLNNDQFQLLPMDLKQGEVVKAKSSIEEPPELELKDLPSHLDYAYLEGVDKLPVIIAKDLKDNKKEALLKVLKSHKRAIAWKITDIKGIDPRFCTHKILMEEDYKPALQSQRRVNPKIHKDKLFELAKVPLNENCSAMLLKKLPEKLGDLEKFFIPCDFPGIDVCHALADLGTSINLMPLSIWKKLSLPELTPTRMTFKLADRSITRPKGVAEDIFVKVGKFHFPTDFVVVDFEADPRVPLILKRSFLRTGCALIDVYEEEITLRVNDESVTFNLNKTMRYSSTYDDNSVNRIDVIDIACEEYAQDVWILSIIPRVAILLLFLILHFLKRPRVIFVKSQLSILLLLHVVPLEKVDFFWKKLEIFSKMNQFQQELKILAMIRRGDILYQEKLLNDDPSQLPPMDLKQADETKENLQLKSLQN
nr:reverse transcriptase domain-containing protein [Tanacetum cinerariifolium]